MAVVVLPTPPFWLATANRRGRGARRRRRRLEPREVSLSGTTTCTSLRCARSGGSRHSVRPPEVSSGSCRWRRHLTGLVEGGHVFGWFHVKRRPHHRARRVRAGPGRPRPAGEVPVRGAAPPERRPCVWRMGGGPGAAPPERSTCPERTAATRRDGRQQGSDGDAGRDALAGAAGRSASGRADPGPARSGDGAPGGCVPFVTRPGGRTGDRPLEPRRACTANWGASARPCVRRLPSSGLGRGGDGPRSRWSCRSVGGPRRHTRAAARGCLTASRRTEDRAHGRPASSKPAADRAARRPRASVHLRSAERRHLGAATTGLVGKPARGRVAARLAAFTAGARFARRRGASTSATGRAEAPTPGGRGHGVKADRAGLATRLRAGRLYRPAGQRRRGGGLPGRPQPRLAPLRSGHRIGTPLIGGADRRPEAGSTAGSGAARTSARQPVPAGRRFAVRRHGRSPSAPDAVHVARLLAERAPLLAEPWTRPPSRDLRQRRGRSTQPCSRTPTPVRRGDAAGLGPPRPGTHAGCAHALPPIVVAGRRARPPRRSTRCRPRRRPRRDANSTLLLEAADAATAGARRRPIER